MNGEASLNKLHSTMAKLIILGNAVEQTSPCSLIARDLVTNKANIVVINNGRVLISDSYDSVKHLPGSDYYLVKCRKGYSIVNNTEKVKRMSVYTDLSRCVMASNGRYNAIAKLQNGLTGVIDTNDNTIIQFIHSQMSLYRIKSKWVYVGDTLDNRKLYKDDGTLYKISNTLSTRDFIVCEDGILTFVKLHDALNTVEYQLMDLDNNEIFTLNEPGALVKMASNAATVKVLLDDTTVFELNIAKKYE